MLAGALCLALAAAGPSEDGLAAVRSVLLRNEATSPCREELLVRRLTALGPAAAPALFALHSGDALDAFLGDSEADAWLCAPDRVGALAFEALVELPAVPVRELLARATAARPEREVRVAALRVLGRQGSADGLELLLELLRASGDELLHRSVQDPAVEALGAVLKGDARALSLLEKGLAQQPLELQALACRAAVSSGRPDAVGLLTRRAGVAPALDLVVLDGLAELGSAQPWRLSESVPQLLRTCLERPDPELRAAAARALGRLGDAPSAPALIARLQDADPRVARAARWALEECTGERRAATFEDWQAWLEAEREWWRQEGRPRVEGLRAGDAAELTQVLRDALRHPFARLATAEALAELLPALEPGAQAVACATLAQLRAKSAVPALIELLSRGEPEVRDSAWKALCRLTGAELAPEPRVWEEFAFG
jgi:HEAT repeat protein